MAEANLISEGITSTNYTPAAVAIADTTMPLAKMGKGNRFHVIAVNGLNNFVMAGFSGTTGATGAFAASTPTDQLTPTEAFQIDGKLDDGIPNNGTVRAVTVLPAATANGMQAAGETNSTDIGVATASLASGSCWDSTLNIYGTSADASKNALGCQLRIRGSF